MYYVYEFYIVGTGEIIYVGKGKGKRYRKRNQRNELLTYMLDKYECDSRIVKMFQTENDAFEFERHYIDSLKQNGYCICNIYSGGAGGAGSYWTEELKKEYSEHNVMKSAEQRKRMSERNPMKNHEIAKKVSEQKMKGVIIGDKEYESIKQASEKTGVAISTIVRWCKKGINRNGELCRLKDALQVSFTDKRYNKRSCKGLTYKGVHYESPVDLADELKCNVSKLYHWLKNGFDHHGNPIRYDDDNRDLVFERKSGSNHPVIANGKSYPSISAAARALGTSSQWLGEIVRGEHSSPKYTCKYDNQQPSQGNTDNSTLKGSTTNR